MTTLAVRGAAKLSGALVVPGDKSISHRGLLLAATAQGTSVLRGLGAGEDVAATRRCLEGYGVIFRESHVGSVEVDGGIDGWTLPDGTLDCANSGTTMRLLAGLAARRPFRSVLDGDASLRRRPMDRIAEPLRALGARVGLRQGRLPPVEVEGGELTGADVPTNVASAQVKSSVLLAGLGASGRTTVTEPAPTRDHTERLLEALGAPITTQQADGAVRVTIEPFALPSLTLDVPGDFSSAAFVLAAALLCGEVRIDGVGLNPTRTGFLDTVSRMGGRVEPDVTEERMREPVGVVKAERSDLRGVRIDPDVIPIALVHDELPLVAVLATQAEGRTEVSGAEELRVKEADRIATICGGLEALGASIEERPDGFVVEGPTPLRGASVDAHGDHRVAMALAVAGLAASGETRVAGFEAAAVSWPSFADALAALGADLEVVG